ncbi:MAG: hypothetical protein ACRDNT_09525, partial [Streptosporangiaceae bacterium]
MTQHPAVLPHGSANLSVPAYLWPRQVKRKASREKCRRDGGAGARGEQAGGERGREDEPSHEAPP